MTTFASTPGNSRSEVLRSVIGSPRHRVQRVLQVTRALWWPEARLKQHGQSERQAYGPGGRPLKMTA